MLCAPLAGCTPAGEERPVAPSLNGESTTNVLVVDDPALAVAIREFAGEWKSLTGGGQLEIQELTVDQALTGGGWQKADAALYPAHLVGVLATQQRIEPLGEDDLTGDTIAWNDIFPLLRLREAAWGEQVYAVPLGSPQLVCFCRADMLAQFGREPPRTWQEYQELKDLFSDRSTFVEMISHDAPWHAVLEPLAAGWAGLTLLARAAAYAKHPDHYSALFNMEDMEPLIDGPPFVRALEELVAACAGEEPPPRYDVTAVRAAFWRGECALALTWPTAAAAETGEGIEVTAVPLPSSRDVFNPGQKAWEQRESAQPSHVPLIAFAGRLASIAADTPQRPLALRLLNEIAGRQWGGILSPRSPATTLFRQSHISSPAQWVEAGFSITAATAYAELVSVTCTQTDGLPALRIPGRRQYLAVLDEAVWSTLYEGVAVEVALRRAAARWREITRELASDRQRQAYQRSLGVLP